MAYKKVYKKKNMVSRRKTSLTTLVHKVMLKDETPQYQSQSDLINYQTTMTHNTVYTWNPFNSLTYGTTSGTEEYNRTTDQIHVDYLKLNMLASATQSASSTLRLMLVKANSVYTANVLTSSGLSYTELYIGGTGNRGTAFGITDPREITVLWDKTITMSPRIAATGVSENIKHTIKLNRKITYIPGTNTLKGQQYYFVAIPYVLGGTTAVTNAATLFINSSLKFKNAV